VNTFRREIAGADKSGFLIAVIQSPCPSLRLYCQRRCGRGYTVIDGEIIAEKRSGVRSLYVQDPLGSMVALLDNTQAQTDTFSYWPYGENNGRSGTTATPFQFVGMAGYYRDSGSRTYVSTNNLDVASGGGKIPITAK
jgi:hypothetical protein